MKSTNQAKNREYMREYRLRKKRERRDSKTLTERKIGIMCRFPESLLAQLQRMKDAGLALGIYPWKTTQEIIRALIYKGLETMKGDEVVDDWLPMIALRQQIDTITVARKEAHTFLGQIRYEVQALIDLGAEDEAIQYFSSTLDTAKALPSHVWSNWLVEQLRGAFPELTKKHDKGQVPAARLGTAPKRRKTDHTDDRPHTSKRKQGSHAIQRTSRR